MAVRTVLLNDFFFSEMHSDVVFNDFGISKSVSCAVVFNMDFLCVL